MAFYGVLIMLSLIFLYGNIWRVHAAKHVHRSHEDHLLRGVEANVTTNASLWAPYYRNINAMGARMISTGAHDLEPRAGVCQCLDPDETCCSAKSNYRAPFCIPKNSTCCSNTFCDYSEFCCGDFCCPSETICTVNRFGAGCCPKGQLCSGPAICYDYISPNCTSPFSPLPQCCPPHVPICHDFPLIGIGCFPTSAVPALTKTVGEPYSASSASSRPESRSNPYIVITVTETILFTETGLESSSLLITESTLMAPASSISLVSATTLDSPSLVPESTTTETTDISTIAPTSSTIPTLCFNPDLQAPGPCPTDENPFTPRPAVSTFNPSGKSSKAVAAIPACLGISVLFTLSLLITGFGCCLPLKKANSDETKFKGEKPPRKRTHTVHSTW